jgi:hypothetical protein
MPDWYCRTAAAGEPELCKGPRHDCCGMRYAPGEYTLSRDAITLPDIGAVPTPGLAPAFIPKSAAAIVYRDGAGWTVEFNEEEGAQS